MESVKVCSRRPNRILILASLLSMGWLLFVHEGAIVMVHAADPDPLQDFCVADFSKNAPRVNGFPCKLRSKVTAADFVYSGLRAAGACRTIGIFVFIDLSLLILSFCLRLSWTSCSVFVRQFKTQGGFIESMSIAWLIGEWRMERLVLVFNQETTRQWDLR